MKLFGFHNTLDGYIIPIIKIITQINKLDVLLVETGMSMMMSMCTYYSKKKEDS